MQPVSDQRLGTTRPKAQLSNPARGSSSRQRSGQQGWISLDRLRVCLLRAARMGPERIARTGRGRLLRGRDLAFAAAKAAQPMRRGLVLDEGKELDRARPRSQEPYGPAQAGGRTPAISDPCPHSKRGPCPYKWVSVPGEFGRDHLGQTGMLVSVG